jgi:integrase
VSEFRQGRCKCPWEASVYSKRDQKKIRKTFPTREAAIGSWRDDAKPAVRRNGLLMPKVGHGRERFATPDECERLLAALPEQDRPLWATAIYAGLRRGELMALAVEDVDLAQRVLNVRRSWDHKEGFIPTKDRKERRVPNTAVLRDYLDEHLLRVGWREGLVFRESPVSPFKPDTVRKRANRVWRNAKLDKIGLHECRHTCTAS